MICGKTRSGLKYAVKQSGSAAGYCSLGVKCGTRDEKGYHSGIAHFVEHTVFKGTVSKKASAINSYLDRLGGELNAFTTKEEIVFHATFLTEDLRKAAGLLFDLAENPTFPENEINTEKGVVIDEINSYKDSPSEEIYDRFEELLFEGHPLSAPILGTASSVRKISSEELKRFTKEKFVPGNMAFTIVANIPEKKLEKEVLKLDEKFFGRYVSDCNYNRDSEIKIPENRFNKTVNKRNHQANCIIGTTAPSLYQEDKRLATILLCNILGGPATNSILNATLREKNGWVYGVECNYTQYSDTGIVAICIGCDKDNLDKCIKVVEKETGRLQNELLSPRRLKAAKKQLLGQLAVSSDNGESQCLAMGKSLLAYGIINSDETVRQKIENISAEAIQSMAKELFGSGRLSKLIFL